MSSLSSEALAEEQTALELLRRELPTHQAVAAEIAVLAGELALPKPTVHVLSDVHGEDKKLRHVINNASGALRPLVERLFAERRRPEQVGELIKLLLYPRETLERLERDRADPEPKDAFFQRAIVDVLEVVRALAASKSYRRVERVFPPEYAALLRELVIDTPALRMPSYSRTIVDALVQRGDIQEFMRVLVRVARNLAVDEIVVAGDLFDRGPRADRVLDYLERQPNVSFTWGNHDCEWIGAALGCEALIACVLRVSARYRRFSQIEEGYGITLQPLERLVRDAYADDPASRFRPRGSGLRDELTLARMQKAAAILQYKLEGQLIERNPGFEMEHRRLLHRMDLGSGTIEIDGKRYALEDRYFPTLDPADPYRLNDAERACIDRIRRSFVASEKLWRHVRFLVERGFSYLVRDSHLVFHGCVPVDDSGTFLPMRIGDREFSGRALFDALDRFVKRALHRPTQKDLDLFFYLWCGPRSPMFGKDRITTLERDLVADPAAHTETKNPYFKLIQEPGFCQRILDEFGVDKERGMIVNGHVPVKIEKGESPLKKSGKAITIDGAFSEAYGDHGYTLVLDPGGTFLAEHHHFDSVDAAVDHGVDIIPSVSVVRRHDPPRRVADTEQGDVIRARIRLLERLAERLG